VFRPYDSDQITQILEKRNTSAFAEGVLNRENIKLCVELAGEEGNASKAVTLLERAGNIADTLRSEEITEKHFRVANEEMSDSELERQGHYRTN
jgi:cell division control protein 6